MTEVLEFLVDRIETPVGPRRRPPTAGMLAASKSSVFGI